MTTRSLPNRGAFTLLELLAVIAIIALIAGFVVPAFTHIGQSGNLTNAANELANELGYAQQLAIKNNLPTQVLFYAYSSKQDASPAPQIQGYQIWSQIPGQALNSKKGYRTVSKVIAFPAGIAISPNAAFTTLTSNPAATTQMNYAADIHPSGAADGTWKPVSPGNGAAADHTYFSLTFYPDGSTDLADPSSVSGVGAWSLTLYPVNSAPVLQGSSGQITGPAANFVTLVIDPLNGVVRTYRPG